MPRGKEKSKFHEINKAKIAEEEADLTGVHKKNSQKG